MKNLLFIAICFFLYSNFYGQHLDIKIETSENLGIPTSDTSLDDLIFSPIVSNKTGSQITFYFISNIEVSTGYVHTTIKDIDNRLFSRKKIELKMLINTSDTLDTYHKYYFTLDSNTLKHNKLFRKFLKGKHKGYKFLEVVLFLSYLKKYHIRPEINTGKVGKAVVSNKDFEDDKYLHLE